MAKRASSKKKGAKGRRGTFAQAMRALEGAGVPKQQVGRVSTTGTANIDLNQIEALKKKLGSGWRKVRFVALNAPFKRRSPITPA
jgi:hypothetical protein